MRNKLLIAALALVAVFAVGAGDIGKNPWPTKVYGSMLVDAFIPFEVVNGLVGWWPFEEGSGSTTADTSGEGNDGTLVSMESEDWVTGLNGSGYALEFDGTETEVISGIGAVSDYSFIQNTGVFTLSACIKLDTPTADDAQTIAGNTLTKIENGFFWAYENRTAASAQKQMRVFLARGDDAAGDPIVNCLSATDAITDSNVHHVALVGDGSDLQHYVDGSTSGSSCALTTLATGDSDRKLWIGMAAYHTNLLSFDGTIDDVRIYDEELTAAEIAALADECQ